MGVIEKLNSVKNTIPHYWPIGSFIHHNPLKGFEHLGFKDGLNKAKKTYGGKVYMDSSYYLKFYNEGKISHTILSVKDSLTFKMLMPPSHASYSCDDERIVKFSACKKSVFVVHLMICIVLVTTVFSSNTSIESPQSNII